MHSIFTLYVEFRKIFVCWWDDFHFYTPVDMEIFLIVRSKKKKQTNISDFKIPKQKISQNGLDCAAHDESLNEIVRVCIEISIHV